MSFVEEFSFKAADSPSIDAFGRLRTSTPTTLFESKLLLDNAPLLWDDAEVSGGGTSSTYNTNQSSVTLAVTNLTAGRRTRQTKRRFNYQAGKSQLIMCTGIFGAGSASITKRIGYFDDKNGLFFELSGTTFQVVRRTYTSGGAVDNAVAKASWNLDTMDGNGPSGISIDLTTTQIFVIDFEWLGVGRVRMGFVVDGKIYYCHEFLNANSLTLVYMSVPNLPVRYEIINSGAGGNASLVQICSSVMSEGGQESIGQTFGLSRGSTALTTLNDADLYPLIALRYQSGRELVPIRLVGFSVATASATWAVHLLLNPTVAGTALSFTSITNSALERDISTTNASKVSGGTSLYVTTGISDGNIVADIESPSDISLGSTIAGTSDILVLAVQRLVGTTEAFYGSINWRESR